jgi:phosphatidylglycerol:prolipoprotein diacylglycerol transferase|tara:strand:- start:101 stop:949 length:849 start_codon:yes stop_codon:yes gene_type:complete
MSFSLLNTSYWIHDLSPFLWKFPGELANWGPGGIRWYGISYLLGFISAYFLLKLYFKHNRSPYDQEQIMNLVTFQVIGVLVGGRIGYLLLYQGEKFLNDPLTIFRVWEGGMASHGGFIGVFVATLWYAKKSSQSIKPIGDLIVSVVPPGLFFGRLANFINGELWGKVTLVEWGVIFPKAPDFALGMARHPSQIYAALSEGLIPFIYIQWRFWRSSIINKYPGQLAGEFLILYSVARIFNELFREPDATLLYGISRGQFYSIFLLIGGIFIICWARKAGDSAK